MTLIRIFENRLDSICKENWTSKWWFCCCVDYYFTASHCTTLVTTYFCSWGCSCRNVFPSPHDVYSQTMLNHSSVTTHIQLTEEEWEGCLLNLDCMYKTLQSCSVSWSQNSRSIYASKIQDWDLHLGTWESTRILVSKCKACQLTPKPICSVRISHLAPKLWEMSPTEVLKAQSNTCSTETLRNRILIIYSKLYPIILPFFIVFVNCSTGGPGSRPSLNPTWAFKLSSFSLETALTAKKTTIMLELY